jgi:2-methylcitrate dehydratase PrpD
LLPLNLTYHRPTTGLEGKFSMEFCLASILCLRRAGLTEFSDAVVNRPDVQQAIRKIDYVTYSDADAEAGGYAFLTTFLDIAMTDGRRFSARADTSRGSSVMPMSEDEVADKFRACAEFAGCPRDRAEEIIEMTLTLETLPDVSVLAHRLGAGE